MKIFEYPPQEPMGEFGERYHQRVLALGDGLTADAEIAYGTDLYQRLLISAPPPDQTARDVLVFFHGGGWTNGYKEWMSFMAPALVERGVIFVSPGYRLAPKHLFPSGYEDCVDAVAWVYRNIGSFGGNPRRIFVGGHSAGGHYAALLALRGDLQRRHDVARDAISGVLPISATYYFTEGSGLSVRPRFLGPENRDMEAAASPMAYVGHSKCPFFIAHGSDDFPHLSRQAHEFEAALLKACVPVERLELDSCDHGGASVAAGQRDGLWVSRATKWMKKQSG